jgi:hypothetical protein
MVINALNEAVEPTEAQIKAALGRAFVHFEAFAGLTAGFEREWRHYGKKYGWKLKVHADDKTLAEVTVGDTVFLVAVSLREQERKDLEADPTTLALLGEAADGAFFKFEVRHEASFARMAALVKFVMARRTHE